MTDPEQEARARHLTATLEEAVGGSPRDLTNRIVDRLAALPPRRSRAPLLATLCAAAGVAVVVTLAVAGGHGARVPAGPPQDPAATASNAIPVAIHCVDDGKAVPLGSGAGRGKVWQGRRLQWRIGDVELDTTAKLTSELRRLAKYPGSFRPDPDDDTKQLMRPLRIEARAGARFCDVIATTDAATASGFLEIRWAGVDIATIVPKSLVDPAVADTLVVPDAVFCEPDEAPHPRRPVVDLHQDGTIVHDDTTLFPAPQGQPGDYAAVRSRLQRLRADLPPEGEVPVLLRADRFVEWSRVQRVLALAHQAGFHRLEVAVARAGHAGKAGEQPPPELSRKVGK